MTVDRRRIGGLGALGLAFAVLTGCDGGYSVRGTAYRWVKAPVGAASTIVVDKPWEPPLGLAPLEGVEVTVYHSEDDVGSTDETAQLWRDKLVSASDGGFDTGGATAPGKRKMAIVAQRTGCKPAPLTTFDHEGLKTPHTVAIVLVCPDLP